MLKTIKPLHSYTHTHMHSAYCTYMCEFTMCSSVKQSLNQRHFGAIPSNRRHLSCNDCLEDKSEDYQNCSVLYCVPQVYTVISTDTYEQFLQLY